MKTALARLWRDRRGAGAVEFAMVLPLLLGMYFMSMEVGQAIETSRKLTRGAATIGLVATQQSGSVSATELDGMMALGDAAIQPYNRSNARFTITGVKVSNDATLKTDIKWSRSYAGSAGAADCFTQNDPVTIPDELKAPGAFLIVTTAQLCYKPMIAWKDEDKKTFGIANILWPIKMGSRTYQVPRDNQDLACPSC